MSRFPYGVYGRGSDPDPRFSLANERTFLAWVRTGLAMIAGGAALHTPLFDWPIWLRVLTTLILLIAAGGCFALGWFRWRETEVAMRTHQTLPGFGGPTLILLAMFALMACVVLIMIVYEA